MHYFKVNLLNTSLEYIVYYVQWFNCHVHTNTPVDKGPFSRVCFPLVNSRASLLNGLPPPAPLISSSHMDSPTENEKEAVKELQERGWM